MDSQTLTPQTFLEHLRDHLRDVHPSLLPVINFLIDKASGRRVSAARLSMLFESYAHYKLFLSALSSQYLRSICISQYYIVINRQNPQKRYFSETHTYIVGVNVENDKLFTHRHRAYALEKEHVFTVNEIPFYKCDYKDVISAFYFYDVDFDLDPESMVKSAFESERSSLNARVQGDLVITLTRTSMEDYVADLRRQVAEHIAHDIALHIANKIADILTDIHLTSNVDDRGVANFMNAQEVVVQIPFPWYAFNETDQEKIRRILTKLANVIVSRLDLSDVAEYLRVSEIKVKPRINYGEFVDDHYIVDALIGDKVFSIIDIVMDDNMVSIKVKVYRDEIINTQRVAETTDMIANEIEMRPMTINLGRHRVSVEEALPTQITARIETLNGHRIITLNQPLVVRGTITFTHPEHETKVMYVSDLMLFNVQSIVNADTVARLNLYALRQLATKDHDNAVNNKKLDEYIKVPH